MPGKKLRVVELYAGTGRAYEPFRSWRRAELALLVDNSKHARDVYLKNFPQAPYSQADIGMITPTWLENRAGGPIDVLLGCPPCQGFSDTGSRKDSDPRNNHILKFSQLATALQPRVVAMENVPLAVGSPRFLALTQEFERAGYVWTAAIVNAIQFGSTQSRQRLIFVAARKELKVEPMIPQPTHGEGGEYFHYGKKEMARISDDIRGMLGITPGSVRTAKSLPSVIAWTLGKKPVPRVEDAFAGLPRIGTSEAKRMGHVPWTHSAEMLRRMERVPEGGRWKGGGDHFAQAYGRLHRKGLARTVTTYFPNPGSGRYWHPTAERTITLREAARLQGFPDDFLFPNENLSKSATLVGNALDARLAEVSYQAVRACLD